MGKAGRKGGARKGHENSLVWPASRFQLGRGKCSILFPRLQKQLKKKKPLTAARFARRGSGPGKPYLQTWGKGEIPRKRKDGGEGKNDGVGGNVQL